MLALMIRVEITEVLEVHHQDLVVRILLSLLDKVQGVIVTLK